MMYYAVRVGRKAGIFYSWDECKAQVAGFSGAEYKKFTVEQDAIDYLKRREIPKHRLGIYIDGSYSPTKDRYGYSVVLISKDFFHVEYGPVPEDFKGHRNVGSELWSAYRAVEIIKSGQFLINPCIFYDYQGIFLFLNCWKAKTSVSKRYQELMASIPTNIKWVKVLSHEDSYNKIADQYAKKALKLDKVVTESI